MKHLLYKKYDYIIVGAGSAGCVLANRLSKNPNNEVLLIEAGGKDTHPKIKIPATFSELFKTSIDWQNETVPQKHANNRVLYHPRGKVLGGCSSINAMIYVRGHKLDYDHWNELGNEGWSYEEVLPYFKRSENNTRGSNKYHSTWGELNVSDHRTRHLLSKTFLEAAQEQGHPLNEDFNGKEQKGIGFFQLTQKKGKRHSAAHAFLNPVKERKNLSILTQTQVEKINFKGTKADSVRVHYRSTTAEIQCKEEIILSSGSFNSPHLLMLSGIGDKRELKQNGIEVMHHLPGVGKNLQDHIYTGVSMRCNSDITLDTAKNWNHIGGHLWNYVVRNKGAFTTNVAECGGFVKTDPGLEAPDMQFHFGPAFFIEHGFIRPKGNGFSIGPTLLTPESRGTIRLNGSDPAEAPLIDPQFLSDESDVQRLIKGYRMGAAILESKAFAPYREEYFLPNQKLIEDDEIAEHIRSEFQHIYHPVGTCKMGLDAEAVVDPELKVHGLEGLRVVDASIMPKIVRGNTNAPTMMIAEKASDMILQA